ncbi:MAG: bacterial Ig-like domain-containing protein [Treponema sp.]|jgi:hypothetical protein|nr:bacterial Ig-like domain-containing protein [Treponema sp.]
MPVLGYRGNMNVLGNSCQTIILMSILLAGCANPLFKADEDDGTFVRLTAIAITGLPKKTLYARGEVLDITGLEVTGTYTDESEKLESITLSDISGYDPDTRGEQTVTLRVNGKKAEFVIFVALLFETKTLTFSVKEPILITWPIPGAVWKAYIEEQEVLVEPSAMGIYYYAPDTPGTYQLRVAVQIDDRTYSRYYDLTVIP